jgi:hypothetical protein
MRHVLPGELRFLWEAGSNLLLQGPESAITAALAALGSDQQPLWTLEADRFFAWPTPRRGTVVLRGVECLDRDHQHRLMAWLSIAVEPVRVVSTTSERLFERVERRAFLDALYYRLNTVLIDLHADDGLVGAITGENRSAAAVRVGGTDRATLRQISRPRGRSMRRCGR